MVKSGCSTRIFGAFLAILGENGAFWGPGFSGFLGGFWGGVFGAFFWVFWGYGDIDGIDDVNSCEFLCENV